MSEKIKQQEAINKLREIAIELGRTPTGYEIYKHISKHIIYTEFGSMAVFVQAAGLDPIRKLGKKLDNSIFEKDIVKHLEEYVPLDDVKPYIIKLNGAKIAIISDIHWPFVNKKVIAAFLDFIAEHQPDFVIINGDAWDMYTHSKYAKSINIYTPREEESLARKMNEEFWAEVKKRCPKARCFQLLGNHDIRPLKRVLEAYPAAEDWADSYFKKIFTFDGVETLFDHRQELQINDDLIFHGYRSKLGDHRDYTHMNCHAGHSHVGGTVFRRIKGTTVFESNSGVAGDLESKALSYTPQKITHQTPGFSYRDKWGPRFIPV